MTLQLNLRRSVSAPAYSTSVGRAFGAAQVTAGNTNIQTNPQYSLDNCGPENGKLIYTE